MVNCFVLVLPHEQRFYGVCTCATYVTEVPGTRHKQRSGVAKPGAGGRPFSASKKVSGRSGDTFPELDCLGLEYFHQLYHDHGVAVEMTFSRKRWPNEVTIALRCDLISVYKTYGHCLLFCSPLDISILVMVMMTLSVAYLRWDRFC